MTPIHAVVEVLRYCPRRLDYPTHNYTQALHILEHGAPTSVSHLCLRADIIYRDFYDNYTIIGAHDPAVLAKVISVAVNHCLLVLTR